MIYINHSLSNLLSSKIMVVLLNCRNTCTHTKWKWQKIK